ncbi:MAG: helix-turn-helix transcriptional regulator [Clostridia bacterium]|nr:helix-turn-helix transcriptional regulator [Clostridia bacterium]
MAEKLLFFSGGGRFSSPGPWIHGQRQIDSFELILVTRGTVYLQENGREFTLRPNDYLVLHPFIPHGGTQATEEPVEFYWLHFMAGETGILPPPDWEQRFAFPCFGTLPSPSALIQIARQLLQVQESPAYPEETAHHILYLLLAELAVQREQAEPQNALAARVHEYVRAHADRPLTVGQVAEALGYHPDHLSRILKGCYGFTLRQEIVTQRLSRAKLLLQTTDFSVSRIAMELGYEDPNLFEKFFRYHQGITPTAYRNSFSKQHTNHK